jgi:hypothetical protein
MRIRFRAIALALAGLVLGCDSTNAPPPQLVVGPHHGTTVRLPEDKGFVELTNEPEATDRRAAEATSIVAYYLQTDCKSAMEPPPADVKFVIEEGRKGSQTIPLSAEPKSGDPASAGRFASKPGPYMLSGLRGKLNAKIGGQEISTTFAGGR